MLLLPVLPSPFGQIEPFRNLGISDTTTGIMLVIGAVSALVALFLGRFWYITNPVLRFIRRVILITPQQIIITYIAYASSIEVRHNILEAGIASDLASRSVFSLNISVTLAVVHAIGVVAWLSDRKKWKTYECSAGPEPCPYKMAEQLRSKHGSMDNGQ